MGAGPISHLSGQVSQLDTRCKCLLFIGWTVAVLTLSAEQLWRARSFAMLLVLLLAVEPTLLKPLLRRLVVTLPVLALVTCALPFMSSGSPVLQIGPLHVTDQGLATSRRVLTCGSLVITAACALLVSSSSHQLTFALRWLHVPPLLVNTGLLMWRHISTLRDETASLLLARAARSPGRGFGARDTGAILGSLILRCEDRAARTSAAMTARGFGAAPPVLSVRLSVHHYLLIVLAWGWFAWLRFG